MAAASDEHSFVDVEGNPFTVSLDNFEGPFDLLLQLISKRRLDVTEIALSEVTDEFVAHAKAGTKIWDLATTSQFLLVAATLLDLKAARLLPKGEVEDEEDLEILAARDLLFARLLQYRAYKEISKWFASSLEAAEHIHYRPGGLESKFADVLPEVQFPGGLERFTKVAVKVFTPQEMPEMPLSQLHIVQVSVQEEGSKVVKKLRAAKTMTFRALCADADKLHTVVRFLSLLELFRQKQVTFEQLTPLGELTVHWSGRDNGEIQFSGEFDETSEE